MFYIETYFISGLIVVMFIEYLFETFDDEKMKFTGYGERVLYLLLWPIILCGFLKGYFNGDDN